MLAASAAMVACGESDPDPRRAAGRANAAPTPPAPLPGPRARVAGRWRLTVTESGSDEVLAEVRWKVRPSCRKGACGGSIRSTSSAVLSLEESTGDGDYVAETDFSAPCVEEGERQLAENGFLVHRTDVLTVTERVDTPRGWVAKVLTGFSRTEFEPVEGVDRRCQAGTTYEDLRAVRLDPPDPG
jgi:hypothetical protein